MPFIVRHNQVEQVWKVDYEYNRFKYSIFIQGTEAEMRDYLSSEMGYVGAYHALTNSELDAVRKLRMLIYIARQL